MSPIRLHQISMIIALLLAGFLGVVHPHYTEAAISQFSISLSKSSVNIQVGPNQSALGLVKGEITIHRFVPGVSRYIVYLYLEGDPPLAGQVNPMFFEFDPGGVRTQNFTVSIKAPLFTPHTDGVKTPPLLARVKGDWFSVPQGPAGSGEIAPETVMVNIDPYYYFTMNPDPPFKRLWPGTTTTFDVEIYNQGNTYDTVYVTVENEEVWAQRGWAFEIPQERVDVGPREYATVRVVVHTPQNLVLWENSFVGIPVTGYSERALFLHQRVEYHMNLYFQMWGFYLPEVAWAVLFALIFLLLLTLHRHGYLRRARRSFKRRASRRKKKGSEKVVEPLERGLLEGPLPGPPKGSKKSTRGPPKEPVQKPRAPPPRKTSPPARGVPPPPKKEPQQPDEDLEELLLEEESLEEIL